MNSLAHPTKIMPGFELVTKVEPYCSTSSPLRRLRIKAGFCDICDLGVTAITIIVIIVNAVALGVADSIPPLPVVAGPHAQAVAPIVARKMMVTLRIAVAVPHLGNVAVAEDKAPLEGRVVDGVNSELKGDVVRMEGVFQGLVLELDLLERDRRVTAVILADVHDAVA